MRYLSMRLITTLSRLRQLWSMTARDPDRAKISEFGIAHGHTPRLLERSRPASNQGGDRLRIRLNISRLCHMFQADSESVPGALEKLVARSTLSAYCPVKLRRDQ